MRGIHQLHRIQVSRAIVSRNTGSGARSSRQDYSRGGSTDSQDKEKVECYYCHEEGHTKRTCPKLQNKSRKSRSAKIATDPTVSSPEQSITVSADDFAKFRQYQESLKTSSHPVTAIAESGSFDEADYW